MKRKMQSPCLRVLWLALLFPLLMVSAGAPAADTVDSKDSDQETVDDNQEDSTAGKNSIDSKIERLGRIKRLKVIEMRAAQRDGLLQVQATLQNGRLHQDIVYRTKWLDKDGFSVWEDEAWKPLALYARQKQNLLLIAPTPKAVDFRIELQRAAVHKKAQN